MQGTEARDAVIEKSQRALVLTEQCRKEDSHQTSTQKVKFKIFRMLYKHISRHFILG